MKRFERKWIMLTTLVLDLKYQEHTKKLTLPENYTIHSNKLTVTDLPVKEILMITDHLNGCTFASTHSLPCIAIQNAINKEENLSAATIIYEDISSLDSHVLMEEYNRYYSLPVTILTTKRLLIRELGVDEIEKLYPIYKNSKHTKYLPPLGSLEEEQEKHKAYMKYVYNFYRFGLWGAFLKDTDTLIGRVGIQCIDLGQDSYIELAYLIDASYTQQGYAYEACQAILRYAKEELYLPSLIALIHPENVASIALIKKLGFSFEKETPYLGTTCLQYRIDF